MIISALKSSISRVCLIFLILLCSVFASQNTFSGTHWLKDFMTVKYDQKTGLVKFKFVYYNLTPQNLTDGYMQRCLFEYSEDGDNYTPLMAVCTNSQKSVDKFEIKLWGKRRGQNIRIFDYYIPKGANWLDDEDKIYGWAKTEKVEAKINGKLVNTLVCYMRVQWQLPKTPKPIKFIQTRGDWYVLGVELPDKIYQLFYLGTVKKNGSFLKYG